MGTPSPLPENIFSRYLLLVPPPKTHTNLNNRPPPGVQPPFAHTGQNPKMEPNNRNKRAAMHKCITTDSMQAVYDKQVPEPRDLKRHKAATAKVIFAGPAKATLTPSSLPTSLTSTPFPAYSSAPSSIPAESSASVASSTPAESSASAAASKLLYSSVPPGRLSAMVIALAKNQAEDNHVFADFANAIENQATKYAKIGSARQKEVARRVADSLASIFQCTINATENNCIPPGLQLLAAAAAPPLSSTPPQGGVGHCPAGQQLSPTAATAPLSATPPKSGAQLSPPGSQLPTAAKSAPLGNKVSAKSFATVAASAIANFQQHSSLVNNVIDISTRKQSSHTPTTPPKDLRVFLRMPHLQPEVHLYAIREAVAQAAKIPPADVPTASKVNSGYAIHARTEQVRDQLIEKASEIAKKLNCKAVELSSSWYTYVVQDVPKRIRNADGIPLLIADSIQAEVETQTRIPPTSVRLSKHCDLSDESPTATWLISFLQPIPRPFRLFSQSRLSALVTKISAPKQCTNCYDWHRSKLCTRAAICASCGGKKHEGKCLKNVQCPNCKGPYAPVHADCSVRPSKKNGKYNVPTRLERAGIRKMGMLAYNKAGSAQLKKHTVNLRDIEEANAAPASSPATQSIDAYEFDDDGDVATLPGAPRSRSSSVDMLHV